MNTRRHLYWAFAFSIAVHFVLIQTQRGTQSPQPYRVLNASLANRAALSSAQGTKIQKRENSDTQERVPTTSQNSSQEESQLPISRGLVFGSDALDEPLAVKGELILEPDGGFADKLAGRVELDLLIGEDGSVRWVGVAYSELDSLIIQSMTEKLLTTQFTPPKIAGVARMVMIRIEVVINATESQVD